MPDARTIHARLLSRQRAWAEAHEIDVDGEGRIARWSGNLLAPLTAATRAELARHHGDPDAEVPDKRGRLHDLGSGLALAVNVFDHLRDRLEVLAGWLAPLAHGPGRLEFGASLPLGAPGDELALDVDLLLEDARGSATAVVPLFAEPFGDVDPRVRDALAHTPARWTDLHGCALLARDVHANPRRFRRLAVGRVLETALAMSQRFGRHGYRIALLWHDAGGAASRRLRGEIDRLRMRIGGEVEVAAPTWHALLERLGATPPADGGYTAPLRARYVEGAEDRRDTLGGARAAGEG